MSAGYIIDPILGKSVFLPYWFYSFDSSNVHTISRFHRSLVENVLEFNTIPETEFKIPTNFKEFCSRWRPNPRLETPFWAFLLSKDGQDRQPFHSKMFAGNESMQCTLRNVHYNLRLFLETCGLSDVHYAYMSGKVSISGSFVLALLGLLKNEDDNYVGSLEISVAPISGEFANSFAFFGTYPPSSPFTPRYGFTSHISGRVSFYRETHIDLFCQTQWITSSMVLVQGHIVSFMPSLVITRVLFRSRSTRESHHAEISDSDMRPCGFSIVSSDGLHICRDRELVKVNNHYRFIPFEIPPIETYDLRCFVYAEDEVQDCSTSEISLRCERRKISRNEFLTIPMILRTRYKEMSYVSRLSKCSKRIKY